jgi:hypothetical protein
METLAASRSSLQSNWNASPSSNFSGTKARVDKFALARWRQARMKSVRTV